MHGDMVSLLKTGEQVAQHRAQKTHTGIAALCFVRRWQQR